MSKRVSGRLTARPIATSNKYVDKDGYRSNCTYCGWGIFSDHRYEFKGADGFVHVDCSSPKGIADDS